MMDSRTATPGRLSTVSMTLMALSLLTACATHAPPQVDEARVKQFVGRGYATDEHFSIATTFSSWRAGEYAFDLAWTTPVSGNSIPLVIYLPGLGESRTAGENWRTAWAQAGYAVLSVQLLAEDQKAWTSDAAARRGDFGVLARERYAQEAASSRLRALAALLAELQKRHGDEPLLRRFDLSQVAIAGFDVGAYASMLVAGERPKGNAPPVRLPISVAAIIALSPYADFSGSALSTRYQSITMPVLSISGDADSDVAGIVSSPAVRRAPFEYMPSKGAYLLWLANATHAVFSGSGLAAEEAPAEPGADRRGDSQGTRKSGSRREGRGSGNRSSGTDSGGDETRPFGGGRPGDAATSPTDRAMNISLIQGVSTAFLDANLKQDTIAQEWLLKDARRWIGQRGELKQK